MSSSQSFVRNPEKLLGQSNCKAVVLSVSDNHANVLLWTDVIKRDSSGTDIVVDERRSLLKITVTPEHRNQLEVKKRITDLQELGEVTKGTSTKDCKNVIQFLSKLDFTLTSESGAEYSYYTATGKSWWKFPFENLLGLHAQKAGTASYNVELISPVSERQIQRSLPAPSMSLIEETPEFYKASVEPFIESIVKSGSLSWIENVVQGKKEVERLLFSNDDYIINIDTKWRSHPDAKTVPREAWYEHKSVEDLYCLAIVKDSSIRSLRDLRQQHVPMLQSIITEGHQVIESIYGIKKDQLRIFVHYPPQFYQFHVHFTRLENEIGCQVERGHLVNDIIQNLNMDDEFYTKRVISYKVKTSSELYVMANKA